MKLFYAPGACSLSPHIALREASLPADFERVDLRTKKTASGDDFLAVNPKGQVPTLQLDDGTLLTEGPAVVQYIADQAPASKLAPPAGTIERYRLMELLNFVSTEIHKGFSPLFKPDTPDAYKDISKKNLGARFDTVARLLGRVVDAPVERHPVRGLLTGAWARRRQLRLADALYVELAVVRGSALVTTDRRLRTVPMVDVVVA